jgi:hypothetical protein
MSVYSKTLQDEKSATPMYMICVADDPGSDGRQPPPTQIMCEDMYEWAADWLLEVLENKQYPGGPKRETD